jgi:hypothetical protein
LAVVAQHLELVLKELLEVVTIHLLARLLPMAVAVLAAQDWGWLVAHQVETQILLAVLLLLAHRVKVLVVELVAQV